MSELMIGIGAVLVVVAFSIGLLLWLGVFSLEDTRRK